MEHTRSILIHKNNVKLWELKAQRAGVQTRIDKEEPKRGVTLTFVTSDYDLLKKFCMQNHLM